MRSIAVVLVLACFLVAACESAPLMPRHACTSNAQCTAPQICVDGYCASGSDAGHPDGGRGDGAIGDAHVRGLVSIAVMPPTATITCADGAMTTQAFTVVGTYDDGTSAPLTSGAWTATAPTIGAIHHTTGLYTAGGVVAGSSTVTVMANGMMATGTVNVVITRTIIDTGAPMDAATHFAPGVPTTTDPARAATLLYPLDLARMPQNVFPADIQWSGGASGDLYQVRLDAPGVTVRAYVQHSGAGFGFHWMPTREAWRALAESAPDMDVTIAVDRFDGSTVITGTPRTIRFANATIRGAIYYWDLGRGRIQRINGDGSGLVDFMPNPPARPRDGARCVACHAISRDGRRMAAELWDGGDVSGVFDLTGDTTASPPPMTFGPGPVSFLTASFSMDNSRLVASAGNRLFLIDGNTGAEIPTSLPTTASAHPSWSPDNMSIAYVVTNNTTSGWAVDFTHGDLAIIDVLGGDAFGPPRQILGAGSTPVISRPSWSPDSTLIAFQHGVHSRSFLDPGVFPTNLQPARVEMVTRDGSTPYPLDALNGGDSNSFYPTFSPFDLGGYYWLAFFSTRDYGNTQVGTAGTGRRQLWVAAVSSGPTAGADPSCVPYWLPQQNVADQNMAAFWTQEPCHMDGLSCATSGECCSGFCRDGGSGFVCVPPTMVMCSMVGEACTSTADCCVADMTLCNGGRCTQVM